MGSTASRRASTPYACVVKVHRPHLYDACSSRYALLACHEPLAAAELFGACSFQSPDIELPETVPVYVSDCEPTVPKLIVPPFTVPLIGVGELPSEEILIVPLRFDPDCCHVSSNVPLNVPLYCPFQVPERADDELASLVAAWVAVVLVVLLFDVAFFELLLQPSAKTGSAHSTAPAKSFDARDE